MKCKHEWQVAGNTELPTGKWMCGTKPITITNLDVGRVQEIKKPAVVLYCQKCSEVMARELKTIDQDECTHEYLTINRVADSSGKDVGHWLRCEKCHDQIFKSKPTQIEEMSMSGSNSPFDRDLARKLNEVIRKLNTLI